MILRCTEKARQLFGGGKPTAVEPSDDWEDDWYANLVWHDRRKCVLLVHAGTLFSVFVPDVRRMDLIPFHGWVTTAIHRSLDDEHLPHTSLGPLDAPVVLAKTASRQILGHMNEITHNTHYLLSTSGGLHHADITKINRWNHRNFHHRDGHYTRPIDLNRP